jgi:hypothetical protein
LQPCKVLFPGCYPKEGLSGAWTESDGGRLIDKMQDIDSPTTCTGACMQSKNKCDMFVYDKEDKYCWLMEGAELRNGSQLGGWCPGKGESPDQSQ